MVPRKRLLVPFKNKQLMIFLLPDPIEEAHVSGWFAKNRNYVSAVAALTGQSLQV